MACDPKRFWQAHKLLQAHRQGFGITTKSLLLAASVSVPHRLLHQIGCHAFRQPNATQVDMPLRAHQRVCFSANRSHLFRSAMSRHYSIQKWWVIDTVQHDKIGCQ
jgi:hypothetical protein